MSNELGHILSFMDCEIVCLCVCVCVLQGYVRFREEGAANKAREGLLERAVGNTGVAQLCGADTELRVLEGQLSIAHIQGFFSRVKNQVKAPVELDKMLQKCVYSSTELYQSV